MQFPVVTEKTITKYYAKIIKDKPSTVEILTQCTTENPLLMNAITGIILFYLPKITKMNDKDRANMMTAICVDMYKLLRNQYEADMDKALRSLTTFSDN